MGDFLKKIGKGLITIALSPIGVIIFTIASVTAVITFVWLFLKATFLFFSGKSIFDPNKKDRLAEAILSGEYVEEAPESYPTVQPERKVIKKPTPLYDLSEERINDIPAVPEEKVDKKKDKAWSLEDIPVDEEGEKL
jgi:hypothetical protein